MQQSPTDILPSDRAQANPAPNEPAFSANEIRLNLREWLLTLIIAVAAMAAIPRIWQKHETFTTGPDYRIPYALSNDYWLFSRRLAEISDQRNIAILGDSVIWGEYVRADGTLSHFLNQDPRWPNRFVNCAMNGLHPLALEGLVKHYGSALRNRKVIVHCNVLWMSSPKADLSSDAESDKKEPILHSRLIPQFYPRIPRYSADGNERLSSVIEPHVQFFAWTTHLQNAYYDQLSIPKWTLAENGKNPPGLPNAWRNPLAPLDFVVPGEPANDPQRGPASRRHKPWNSESSSNEGTHFEWVSLDASLQWQAFQRFVRLLRSRGNEVLVIVGPFNEHMVAEDQQPYFRQMQDKIRGTLAQGGIPVIVAPTLPSDLYADTSHPLTGGYAVLAKAISDQEAFQKWVVQEMTPP